MKVLAVIPARGGSTRVPLKNLAMMGQFTLTHHAIRQAVHCVRVGALVDAVLSTDHPSIAAHAHSSGIPIVSRDIVGDGPMAPVLIEALDKYQRTTGKQYDAVCCLQPTSPFRVPADIAGTIALLMANPQSMSAVSVNEVDGQRNSAVYVTRCPMLRDGFVYAEDSLRYSMPQNRSLDINTPADLERAREMWQRIHS